MTTMGIASLVCLKTTLKIVPMMISALEGLVAEEEEEGKKDDASQNSNASNSAKNVLAKAILSALGNPELKEVLVAVEEVRHCEERSDE